MPREARERPNLDGRPSTEGQREQHRMSFDWEDLAWLRGITRLPLVIKAS